MGGSGEEGKKARYRGWKFTSGGSGTGENVGRHSSTGVQLRGEVQVWGKVSRESSGEEV